MNGADERSVDVRTWIGVLGTMLGAFMAILDLYITNASLRDITGGIAATQDEGSWISTSYLIGEIVTVPLTAWLSRVFSLRWYLLGNVGLFLIFSCLCATAHSLDQLIWFRACQGFTGGVMIPMALTVTMSMLPRNRQPLGLMMFGITGTLGPPLGLTVGGWLTATYGWPWVFYVNLLPGALMLAAILFAFNRAPMQLSLLRRGDWLGMICMCVGLGSLTAMLEEGQRDDWFSSSFIQICALLAAFFIPAFVFVELARNKPLVNLRLIAGRNLGIASAVNFIMGVALYGSVYLLPQYLTLVQGYDALQTGQVMIWVGLPQLIIFPFVPRLMKSFDLRAMVCFGCLVFAASSWLNTSMSPGYAGDQFAFPNVIRALGQPFTLMPLSLLATSLLQPTDIGDGSAVFTITRNIGGSVGTALLDTLLTRREQFYDFEIGTSINHYRPLVEDRIQALTTAFVNKGYDTVTATQQAYAQIKNIVRENAYVMAFSDAFLAVAAALVAGALLVWFCRPVRMRDHGAAE
ncbi:MAG TPA: DHA2 family efflux MFS transporter permease subunit [Chthoniobacterales bacterium]